jgi:membrane fusion protein, multidrug efflux system
MEQATLTAPFDGVIANLFEKRYNMPKTSGPFCRFFIPKGIILLLIIL